MLSPLMLGPIITTQAGSLKELKLCLTSAAITGPDSAIIVSFYTQMRLQARPNASCPHKDDTPTGDCDTEPPLPCAP